MLDIPQYLEATAVTKQLESGRESVHIVAFSDTHISGFTGLFNQDAFSKGMTLIASIFHSKDFAPDNLPLFLHLGDVTDTGTYEDYVYSRKVLYETMAANGLEVPVHYLMGNHDTRNIGDEIFEEMFGPRQFLLKSEEKKYIILGLDSCIPDKDEGSIGGRGLDEIKKLETFGEEWTKIVLFHHQLVPIPFTGRERSTLLDAGDVADVLFSAGVDAVLTAHRHYPNVYRITKENHNCVIVNTGTFSSNKTRGKAGHTFAEIIIDEGEKVEVRMIGIESYSIYQDPMVNQTSVRRYVVPQPPLKDLKGSLLTKIVQISDTHFTSGGDYQDAVFRTGAKIINSIPDVSLLIHCGDVTDDSYPESFAIAKDRLALFDAYPQNFLAVPGERDMQPLGRQFFLRTLGPLDPIFEDENIRILGINNFSTSQEGSSVGRYRVQAIEEDFKMSTKPFILVMHRSLLPLPLSTFTKPVEDSGDVIGHLNRLSVPLVLSGDQHVGYSLQLGNTVYVNSGPFSSKKTKTDAMNTFNVVSIWENGMIGVDQKEIHSGRSTSLGRYMVDLLGQKNSKERRGVN